MTRFRAAALHLAGSVAVATAVFLPTYFAWYPDALFAQAGGRTLVLLITGVQLVVGPLLILILYVPGKKGLAFDVALVWILQATALAFGAWVLFESRPAYIVFVKDRFELVRANEIAAEELHKAMTGPYGALPRAGPRIVGARLPKDPDEQFRITMAAMGGSDIQFFPQHFVAYDEVRAEVLSRAQPISRLRQLNGPFAADVDRLVARLGRPEAQLRFLPLPAGRHGDLTVLVDADRGEVLKIAPLRPWDLK